jgi:predicted dinucleotide-binding enzyme
MQVGILGSGLMGGKLGTLFVRAAHEVVFSYARSKEKLNRPARTPAVTRGRHSEGGCPGTDPLLLAVHWVPNRRRAESGRRFSGQGDCPLLAAAECREYELDLGYTTSGAQALAKKMPGAEVVL